MSYHIRNIIFDKFFERKFRKYKNRLTDKEKNKLRQKLKIFKENPFDKKLKTHKLKGELRNYWGFWVNYSDRIIFRFLDNQAVLFIDIGDHDIY